MVSAAQGPPLLKYNSKFACRPQSTYGDVGIMQSSSWHAECGGAAQSKGRGCYTPSRVSPLAAEENWPALSVDSTVPPRRAMALSKLRRVRVLGS